MAATTTTTQAYVCRPPSPPTLEAVTYPALGPHEVLVDILGASVCHSDVRAAAGAFHLPPPLILGHEGAGYVRATGAAVTYVTPGDAVVLAFASCMQCRRCTQGQNPYCDKLFPLNFGGKTEDGQAAATTTVASGENTVNGFFFGQSSMARIALVRESSCVKIEADVTRDELTVCSALGCGLQTGAGAIMNVVKPPTGSTIVIFGGGAVGLSALLAAQLTEPASIILVDNSQVKLDSLPRSVLGPRTRLYNSAGKPNEVVASNLRNLAANDGQGLDYALDCVGNEDILKIAHAALDKLGTLVTVGSGSQTNVAGLSLSQHLVKGITYRGTHQGDSVPRVMIPKLLGMWKDGSFPFDQLLTHFRFEELDRALAEMKGGSVIKPLLVL